jgi:hypothetical protein
MRHFLVC